MPHNISEELICRVATPKQFQAFYSCILQLCLAYGRTSLHLSDVKDTNPPDMRVEVARLVIYSVEHEIDHDRDPWLLGQQNDDTATAVASFPMNSIADSTIKACLRINSCTSLNVHEHAREEAKELIHQQFFTKMPGVEKPKVIRLKYGRAAIMRAALEVAIVSWAELDGRELPEGYAAKYATGRTLRVQSMLDLPFSSHNSLPAGETCIEPTCHYCQGEAAGNGHASTGSAQHGNLMDATSRATDRSDACQYSSIGLRGTRDSEEAALYNPRYSSFQRNLAWYRNKQATAPGATVGDTGYHVTGPPSQCSIPATGASDWKVTIAEPLSVAAGSYLSFGVTARDAQSAVAPGRSNFHSPSHASDPSAVQGTKERTVDDHVLE